MRLYYYPKYFSIIVVLLIGIRPLGKNIPLYWLFGYNVKNGLNWTPTPKIRAKYKACGKMFPQFFLAGSNNPMSLYALYISHLYAIHGTNANFGIGLRVSHCCVRLR